MILTIYNDETSNNAFEAYQEVDKSITNSPNSIYFFQGYTIYQVANETVTPAEYRDFDKARPVATIDIQDSLTSVANYAIDPALGSLVGTLNATEATNSGIRHTFSIDRDLFAEGDPRLVNNKRYFYAVVAYATPRFPSSFFNPSNPQAGGNLVPYLEGSRNAAQIYTGVPHIPTPQGEGIVLNAEFGDRTEITQLEGMGNGGNVLELTDETEAEVLANGFAEDPTYEGGNEPIDVQIYDPYRVPATKFELTLTNVGTGTLVDNTSTWVLRRLDNGQEFTSETNISRLYEQSIGGWEINSLGFTIGIEQRAYPSSTVNGLITSNIEFRDVVSQWLDLIDDAEGQSFLNWVRSGTFKSTDNAVFNDHRTSATNYYDPNQFYETMIDGGIAPYGLVNRKLSNDQGGAFRRLLAPACTDCTSADPPVNFANMKSVNIVLTNDKSKWTRCPVIEMAPSDAISEGGADKNSLRLHASWNRDGDGSYAQPLSGGTNLEAGQTYYVQGNSASTLVYTNAAGTSVTVNSNAFFTPDAAGAFTANFGASVYRASDIGYSWFPGYAIQLETGERLNLMFSENSFLGTDNGNDMIFNPTSRLFNITSSPSQNNVFFGGEHYLYVMNSRYDEGTGLHDQLVTSAATNSLPIKRTVYQSVMYVSPMMLSPGFNLLPVSQGIVPSDVRLTVRMATPYEQEDTSSNVLRYEFDFSNLLPKPTKRMWPRRPWIWCAWCRTRIMRSRNTKPRSWTTAFGLPTCHP